MDILFLPSSILDLALLWRCPLGAEFLQLLLSFARWSRKKLNKLLEYQSKAVNGVKLSQALLPSEGAFIDWHELLSKSWDAMPKEPCALAILSHLVSLKCGWKGSPHLDEGWMRRLDVEKSFKEIPPYILKDCLSGCLAYHRLESWKVVWLLLVLFNWCDKEGKSIHFRNSRRERSDLRKLRL